VRVPDRRDRVRVVRSRPSEHRRQHGPGVPRGGADVAEVEGVERADDAALNLVAERVIQGDLAHQLAERLQVLDKFPDIGVEDRQLYPPQPVQRFLARREHVAHRRGIRPDDRVRRGPPRTARRRHR
jgi:hypothetical protein